MKATLTIIHDRKHTATGTNKEAMLEVRIIYARKSMYFSTGIKVRHCEWVAGRVVGRLDASMLNEQLADIYTKVGRVVNEQLADGLPPSIAEIKNRMQQVAETYTNDDTLLDWIMAQIPMLNISEGTRKHYVALLNRLDEFKNLRRWRDCTAERICEFDAWLHSLRAPDPNPAADRIGKPVAFGRLQNGLSNAAIYNYHKCLKALLNRAVKFDKVRSNPYDRLKGQFKRGERENVEYLTEAEMQRIMQLQLPEGSTMQRAQHLFTFQMFTGLSFSDAMTFDFSQYRWSGSAWIYNGQRVKTGVPYVSQLLPPAVDVLMRYGGQPPRMDNADYNHALKAVGLMAKTSLPLHSHLARHTFATWMLSQGVKVENLRRMLGHKNIVQTMRYAKTLAQNVHDDFDMVRTARFGPSTLRQAQGPQSSGTAVGDGSGTAAAQPLNKLRPRGKNNQAGDTNQKHPK